MSSESSAVPTWDGHPKGWRRYCREVVWYVQATKVGQRRHLATRLIARLSGSARLLAMSWPQSELDNDRGVLIFLRKLAASPLVRRSLPNAAATMSQYFGFRKRQNETISEFLVRETLSYEEFQEALIRLREERSGTDPSLQDFGLEAIFRRQEEEDAQWNRWRNWRGSHDAGAEPAAEASADADATETGERPDAATHGYQRVPLVSEPDLSPQSNVAPEHGMNSADSFVLDVLRGWRLLQAATLSRDEFRDVLSATNNKLDFDSISGALQVLWDDQLIQHPRHAPSQFNAHWLEELEDPQIKEAYQSERMAEALASEASLTWKKAQEATAALRRDRDRGAPKGKSKGFNKGKMGMAVYGDPYMEQFPMVKGKGKGKAKYSNYMDHEMFWAGKSKGKSSKGSSSFSFRPPGPSGVNAYGMELYPIEFMETPEYHEPLDVTLTATTWSPPPSASQAIKSFEGMVDSGATASAGPEASIHRVFECLRQVDPEATLTVDQTLKPRFRYGSGKWGQALCQVTISSWASGHQRKFSVFALPNPPEYHEPWYDDSLLVPILIGMDFLGVNGVGLVLDFVDGYSWMSNMPGVASFNSVFIDVLPAQNRRNPRLVIEIFGVMPPKTNLANKAPELDHSRALPADPRDPRCGECWPCFGSHNASVRGSNRYGQWTHCAVCNLRTQYVPRMGSLTHNVEHIDPHYVAKALSMVQKDLKGVKPHYKLMKVAVEKIESDERYYQMVLGAPEMTPVPKSPTRHQMFTPPRRSMHNSEEEQIPGPQQLTSSPSWQHVTPPKARAKSPTVSQMSVASVPVVTPQDLLSQLSAEVGKAAVKVLQLMMLGLFTNFHDLVVEPHQVDVWEICCSPQSWLSEACTQEGLKCQRINLANGFDLNRPHTFESMTELYKIQRPKRLWISMRCTLWCAWTSLNYNTPERVELLESKRRKERKVLSSDTARSSYYPWKMVVAIAKTWKSQLVPERWQSILFLTVDSNVPNSTFEQQLWEMNPAEMADDIAEVPPDEGYSPTSLAPEDAPAIPADLADDDGQMVLPPAQDERSGGDLRPQSMQSSKASNPSQMASSRWQQDGHGRWSKHEADGKIIPSTKQLAEWNVKLQKFHKASGDQTPGGSSSGKIPPVSTNRLPQAWHMVMMDVGEWNVVSVRKKLKFLLMIDAATKFRSTVPLMVYDINQQGNENAKMVIEAFGRGWLAEKPKPLVVVPDNANTLCSAAFREFCHTNNLWLSPPVEKEAWAHGIAERAVQETKLLADKIFISDGTLSLELCLALSTAALNSTENAHGFSPFQWAYGHSFQWTDEDITTHLQLQQAHPLSEFEKLLSCRRKAENLARQVRANNILVRLKNSCPRQPLQNFEPATLVKVWRKSLPHEAAKGKRSGFTKTIKPHWVGPGRVLFQELLPSQSGGDRRHVVWVVLGGRAHRCSVHSVRPLTSQEEALHEIQHGGEEMSWKSITDFLPRRDYVDMLDDEPGADDVEAPDLPAQPDKSTWLPSCRLYGKTDKQGNDKAAQALKGAAMRLPALPPVNEYEETDFLPEVPDDTFEDDLGNSLNDPGVKRKTDLLESEVSSREASSKRSSLASSSMRPMRPHSAVDSDDIVTGDSVKKPRTDDDNALTLDLHAALQEAEFGYIMEMELDFSSHRKLKKFLQAPNFYLVQQMRDCEVRYERLTDDFKKLFDRAKDKEVASFLKSEAVRKCISKEEEEEGKNSGRVMKCRWVLTWKDTPPDERQASQQDAHENAGTLFTPSGDRKAKARIVLLGYQHPDLLNPEFRSSAPVQSTLTRHLTFQLSVQNQWPIEGMDLSTAFLQTEKNQEQNRIWTSGVRELRAALGVSEGGIMRILKDFYGSTTAPRGLWLDIDRRLRRLGAHKVLGDPCAWIWVEENPNAVNQLDRFRTIGYMGGHVDDFNRSGDETNPKWQKIKAAIDREYQWGSSKVGAYRYVGSDIHHRTGSQGNYIMVDQDSYVENLADVEIDPVRFKNAATVLTKSEIGKCRSALGALQWLAVQTQPQICARCNLLLSELAREPKMTVAQEIQQVIRETRKHPHRLRFDRIPSVNHWQQMVVVTMSDQAHNNRPDGSSTGGLINFLGGPELLDGSPGRLVMVSWRTWKLRRVAISSNDAEIQAMVEAEDVIFRTRLLWAELNGAGAEKGLDLLAFAEQEVSAVPGVVATDSKGGFDAVTLQEGPYLGLSNVRSAIQAFQLKQSFADTKAWLIWLASDWLLADALTKKIQECRKSLLQFMRTGVWMLQYNPGFETSARKNKRAGKDALTQMKKATEKFAS
ncbi:unnamed protein product [Cladocopium goreaui]|uniref:Retrovirus-related Pol polyprotein from transposon RE2 (Retro element 2) (AtRE2) n=1 Tax=Cladocopium goreaui TaxID=2562237 RepID=A0A9P1DI59_9DINO|nr:unnamed protein product [Cladocopium goreaui]